MRTSLAQPRRALACFLLGLGLTAVLGCGRGEDDRSPSLAGGAAGWNVLLLSVDTLRADRLGAYGYAVRETSPAMDELLGRGVRVEVATAPRALTWPSMATVLSGRYPSGHGVVQNGQSLPADLPTLATVLAAAGYQTGAFLENMCRANHLGWDRLQCINQSRRRIEPSVANWLDELEPERPFFLWTHLFGPHSPYRKGRDLASRHLNPGYNGPVGPKKALIERIMIEGIELGPEDQAHLDAVYDAAVIGTDEVVARLLEILGSRGLLEQTVVVFVADHGEELYDHNRYILHACSVYETGLHVPLGFVAPGLLPADGAIDGPVELLDIKPTLLELLGIEDPSPGPGRSLLPTLAGGPGDPQRPVFSEYGDTAIHTVRQGPWKLIVNPEEHQPLCFVGAPPDLFPIARYELYNLVDDPGETENLAERFPDRVEQLSALLEARFAELEQRRQTGEIPEDLRRQLEALGYVTD